MGGKGLGSVVDSMFCGGPWCCWGEEVGIGVGENVHVVSVEVGLYWCKGVYGCQGGGGNEGRVL